MAYASPPRLNGLDFSDTERTACRETGGILRSTLEFGPACNLRCLYCYASDRLPRSHILSEEECCRVVREAAEAGARTVVLIGGGEPLLYPYWKGVTLFIRQQGLTPVLFTNGQLLDRDCVSLLEAARASVILKMDSPVAAIQDEMAGKNGAGEAIRAAASLLLARGFAGEQKRFAIHAVISTKNKNSLAELWRWAREHSVIPMFQLITPRGRGATASLQLSPPDALAVFRQLLELDQQEFGYTWPLQPPYVAGNCDKFLYNLYVNFSGTVSPCVGVDMPLGNIRVQSVADILKSPAMELVRSVMKRLHGACSLCERIGRCYGCRGTAFAATRDPFSSDPSCWSSNAR